MNPEFLPINLTRPTPNSAQFASTLADWIADYASWTAVSNPKLLSIIGMSLSIVFGMPTIAICSFLRLEIIMINNTRTLEIIQGFLCEFHLPLNSKFD